MTSKPAIFGGKPAFDKVIPISCPTLPAKEKIMNRFSDILDTGMLTTSRTVAAYEKAMAEYIGVKHVVATSSNTAGLLLTLKSLNLKGDVVLPSFTFSVTGHVLKWNGLNPIFVDIDPKTCLIDPKLVEAAITPNTCAIIGVHVWGNPCAIEELQAIAAKHKIPLIFDAAQAMGSQYRGRRLGNFGKAEIFSCSPTKLLTSAEGGIVATNDEELAKRVRVGRNYGDDGSYDCWYEGINGRLSEFHAAIGLSCLEILEENLWKRQRLADLYRERLSKLPGLRFPSITDGCFSNMVYFSIVVDENKFGVTREQLYKGLEAENVQTRRYYFPPLHRQSVNRHLTVAYEGRLPHTDYICEHALTLPMFSHMTEEQVNGICGAIERLHSNRDLFVAKPEPVAA